MNYIYQNEIIVAPETTLERIGTGEEGVVYKYSNQAIKIFHVRAPRKMSENICDKFCILPSKHIVLPREKVYTENGVYCGYGTEYIDNNCKAVDLPTNTFIESIEYLTNEYALLSQQQISIDDTSVDNYCCNKTGLYSIDFGMASVKMDLPKRELLFNNLCNLSFFVGSVLYRELEEFSMRDEVLESLEVHMSIPLNLEIIREKLEGFTSVKEYASTFTYKDNFQGKR